MTIMADESMTNDPSRELQYLVAGVKANLEDHAAVRIRAQQLRTGRQAPHWRNESADWRFKAIDLICSIELIELVVIRGRPHRPTKQERSRRCCLEHLLYQLNTEGERHVVFDARRPEQNRADITFVETLRRRGVVAPDLRIEHQPSKIEPLLWIADAVAGAFQIEDSALQRKLLDSARCTVLETRVR